jgi:glycosyltransferase involved in cell wall biosynthesis
MLVLPSHLEGFGLPVLEAMTVGVPVIVSRRGALPELITPAVGALCDTMEETLAAAEGIHTRSPEACRAHAERHFTHVVMAEEYVRMYRCLIETKRLPPGRPTPSIS